VTLAIESFVIVEGALSVFSAGDAWCYAASSQFLAKPGAIVAAICDQRASLWQQWQQRPGSFVVTDLTGGEMEQNWLSGLVANGVQLGV
jgi:hypothetical protein